MYLKFVSQKHDCLKTLLVQDTTHYDETCSAYHPILWWKHFFLECLCHHEPGTWFKFETLSRPDISRFFGPKIGRLTTLHFITFVGDWLSTYALKFRKVPYCSENDSVETAQIHFYIFWDKENDNKTKVNVQNFAVSSQISKSLLSERYWLLRQNHTSAFNTNRRYTEQVLLSSSLLKFMMTNNQVSLVVFKRQVLD